MILGIANRFYCMIKMIGFRTWARQSTMKVPYASYSKLSHEFQAGPPRLPKEQQEEFEKLQKIAKTQIAIEEYNDSVASGEAVGAAPEQSLEFDSISDIGSFVQIKTIPEFHGDVNPKTGEKGGPKQDPLRHPNEWAFNGRVVDF